MSGAAAFVLFMNMSTSSSADDNEKHIGSGAETMPIFDAHIHYKEPAWAPYPLATVLQLMDKSGVAMALVSSTPDEGTIKLWEFAPNRIVPELRPYHGQAGSSNWTKAPGIFDYMLKRLKKYPHVGIGEIHVRSIDPSDEPLLRKIAKLARSKDIYIHVHSGKEPVDLLFSLEPKLNVIWAHAGMYESAQTVADMLAKYRTLYADTSHRELDILTAQGTIDPAWRKVLERFSDRFMVGSDTWINARWDRYGEIIAVNRQWLSHFPRALAEKFAYKNAERLFGRTVEERLIGQR